MRKEVVIAIVLAAVLIVLGSISLVVLNSEKGVSGKAIWQDLKGFFLSKGEEEQGAPQQNVGIPESGGAGPSGGTELGEGSTVGERCDAYLTACKGSGWGNDKVYCLKNDIQQNQPYGCFDITKAKKLTINFKGHKITGAGAVYGVSVKDSSDVVIANGAIERFSYGILSVRSNNTLFYNMSIRNNTGYAVEATYNINGTFSSLDIRNNSLIGLYIHNSKNVTVDKINSTGSLNQDGVSFVNVIKGKVGNVNASKNNWTGIYLQDSKGFVFENVVADDNKLDGIHAKHTNHTRVSKFVFKSNEGLGIWLEGTKDFNFSSGYVGSSSCKKREGAVFLENVDGGSFNHVNSTNNGNRSFFIKYSKGVSFLNILAGINNGLDAFAFYKSSGVALLNATILPGEHTGGLSVAGISKSLFKNINSSGQERMGVYVIDSSSVNFTGVFADNNKLNGFYVNNSKGVLARKLHVFGNGVDGLTVLNVNLSTFEDVNASKSERSGVYIEGGNGLIFNRLFSSKNTLDGVHSKGARILSFFDPVCFANKENGLWLENTNLYLVKKGIITYNKLGTRVENSAGVITYTISSFNSDKGVYLKDSSSNVLSVVLVQKNFGDGLVVEDSSHCNFDKVSCEDNSKNGFVLEGSSEGNKLSSVNLVGNKGLALLDKTGKSHLNSFVLTDSFLSSKGAGGTYPPRVEVEWLDSTFRQNLTLRSSLDLMKDVKFAYNSSLGTWVVSLDSKKYAGTKLVSAAKIFINNSGSKKKYKNPVILRDGKICDKSTSPKCEALSKLTVNEGVLFNVTSWSSYYVWGKCSSGSDCDDGNACTDDSCSDGLCVHSPKDCSDGYSCTVDECDVETGSCKHIPDSSKCPRGSVCNPSKYKSTSSGCGKQKGSSCFPAGTKVLMADGSEKNIEDVKAGDVVESYNPVTDEFVEGRVVEVEAPVREHMCEIDFADGSEIEATNEHPFYVVGQGWKSIDPVETEAENWRFDLERLEAGDVVYSLDGGKRIVGISCRPEHVKTYNLKTIEPIETYFVEGVLVHNKDGENHCGNNVCEASKGEDCHSCALDCGPCSNNTNITHCGNDLCQADLGENCHTCPHDCGPCTNKTQKFFVNLDARGEKILSFSSFPSEVVFSFDGKNYSSKISKDDSTDKFYFEINGLSYSLSNSLTIDLDGDNKKDLVVSFKSYVEPNLKVGFKRAEFVPPPSRNRPLWVLILILGILVAIVVLAIIVVLLWIKYKKRKEEGNANAHAPVFKRPPVRPVGPGSASRPMIAPPRRAVSPQLNKKP